MNRNLVLILICAASLIFDCKTASGYEEPVAGVVTILDIIDPWEFPKYNWTAERVNLRTDADIKSKVIASLDKRTKVKVIKQYNNWTKIEYDKNIGYVCSKYLREKEMFTSNKNRWKTDLTKDDVELLAKIVWIECRGEEDAGRYATIEVIMNRIYHMSYPDTLYEVLSQPSHFTSWKIKDTAEPSRQTYEDIEKVINNKTYILNMDYIYFSTTKRNNNDAIKIGNHWFCKED